MGIVNQSRIIVAAISREELACEIFEGMTGATRPPGASAAEAVKIGMDMDADVWRMVLRSADRVALFLMRQINGGRA